MNTGTTSVTKKVKSGALGVLFLAVFIDLLGFGIVIPLLPFWASSLGASPFIYGLLVSSYSLMQFLFAPLWGRISDRQGRRPVILIGLSGTLLSFIMLTLTALIFQDSLLMLFTSRALGGVFTAATLPTSQAYITDTTSGEERAKGFGLLGAAFGLGFAIGPALGGFLSTLGGYASPALFASVLALINLIAGIIRLPESLTSDQQQEVKEMTALSDRSESKSLIGILITTPVILIIIILFASVSFVFSNLEATLALFGEARFGLNESQTGIVFLVVGIVAILVQGGLIRPLSNRFADGILIAVGIFSLTLGFGGLTTVIDLEGMMIWVIPLAFGSSMANPTLGALLSKKAPKEKSGEVLGLNQGIGSLMRIFGPIVGSILFEIEIALQFIMSAGILAIGSLLSLVLINVSREVKIKSVCINCGNQLRQGVAICKRCGTVADVSKIFGES